VFIPYEHTWVLEVEEIATPEGRTIIRLERFPELTQHF
jgi:hypothetical protein